MFIEKLINGKMDIYSVCHFQALFKSTNHYYFIQTA